MTSRFSESAELQAARQHWLAILVRVPAEMLIEASAALPIETTALKAPEVGLMMTDARIHATGQPFHLGEVSLTRCVLQDDSGLLGYGHILGRQKQQAVAIARFDIALQRLDQYQAAEAYLADWQDTITEVDAMESERVQQTAVEFFTMVRGEA